MYYCTTIKFYSLHRISASSRTTPLVRPAAPKQRAYVIADVFGTLVLVLGKLVSDSSKALEATRRHSGRENIETSRRAQA